MTVFMRSCAIFMVSVLKHGKREDGYVDYVKGANIAGFLKVANSMLDMGVI